MKDAQGREGLSCGYYKKQEGCPCSNFVYSKTKGREILKEQFKDIQYWHQNINVIMKKVFLLLTVMFIGVICYAQTDSVNVIMNTTDSLTKITHELLDQIEADLSLKNRYKIYKTENIYNLLKLDSKTGRIWQIQWSLDSSEEGTWVINNDDLTLGEGWGSNSFELYPTNNIHQFILLDKTTGRTWHVQWGLGDNKRWIRRIY